MEKKLITSVMALMLLICVCFLAKTAAVHTMSLQEEKEEDLDRVIVIDAGHGGSDPGKVGVNAALEKDINLAIACLLQDKLESEGFQVVMTRKSDSVAKTDETVQSGKAADMQERIRLINESEAAVLVSIHQNSYGASEVKGPQVFYYASSKEGEAFARIMQEQLNLGMEISNPRQIKANDNYYLLKKSEIPAIIVECGFLSNWEEAALLCEKEYQEKMAENIFLAICEYFNSL